VNLASDIKALILLNKGVILPGLGGFITRYHTAEIRKDSNTFEPPSMEISFDSRMISDNGMLISHVARKSKLSTEEARSVVDEYIESLKRDLQEKGSASIEELGRIVKGQNGNVTFEAFTDKNYRIESFGLPAIEIPPSSKSAIIPKRILPPQAKPIVSRKRKRIPVAAIIFPLVLFVAVVIYFTGIFDRYLKPLFLSTESTITNGSSQDDNFVFGQRIADDKDTVAMEVNEQLAETTSKEKALYYQEPGNKEQKQPEIKARQYEPVVVPPPAINTGDFHIVAGSFHLRDNAERQKRNLEKKGYTPRIIQKGGKYFYVSLQAFNSKEDAQHEMQKLIRELDLPLWVLEK
jgi:nucleoid DNA-binding protein